MKLSERPMEFDAGMNFKATELRLGLPGTADGDTKPSVSSRNTKRDFRACSDAEDQDTAPPPPKAQIVGWPPVRSYRKNNVQPKKAEQADAPGTTYVKVSMDGAPYLRKIDLKLYKSYQELLKALKDMFKFSIGNYSENQGSDYAPTYEDKDGDWMLVGDVPWNMFIFSCKRLRIMKGAEVRGLTCL